MKHYLLIAIVWGILGSSQATSDIIFSWSNASPVFVRPTDPFNGTHGYLVGQVHVDPGNLMTHYSFLNARNIAGESLNVAFAPEFNLFQSSLATLGGGDYLGPILRFDVYHNTDLGLYAFTGDLMEPVPFLQFHDYQSTPVFHSTRAYYSLEVTTVPEPPLYSGLVVGLSYVGLLRRRCRGVELNDAAACLTPGSRPTGV